jgi:hypothetical protein
LGNFGKGKPKMKKIVSTFVVAALLGVVVSARADERRHPPGYTNADINGGYGCNVSGTLSGAGVVAIAQYHPEGDGTFSESVFTLNIAGIGVCQYSLEPGTGTYDVSANGTGVAQAVYSRQPGSAMNCPAVFNSHISFVCSGAKITADTCDIATLDPGVLLSGTCKKQNK